MRGAERTYPHMLAPGAHVLAGVVKRTAHDAGFKCQHFHHQESEIAMRERMSNCVRKILDDWNFYKNVLRLFNNLRD